MSQSGHVRPVPLAPGPPHTAVLTALALQAPPSWHPKASKRAVSSLKCSPAPQNTLQSPLTQGSGAVSAFLRARVSLGVVIFLPMALLLCAHCSTYGTNPCATRGTHSLGLGLVYAGCIVPT